MPVAKIKTADGWVPFVYGSPGQQGIQGIEGEPGIAIVVPAFTNPGLQAVQVFNIPLPVVRDCTATSVVLALGAAATGSPLIVDIFKNDVTLYPGGVGRPAIAAGSKVSVTNFADPIALVAGDVLTIAIVQVGSTFAGEHMTLQVVAQ